MRCCRDGWSAAELNGIDDEVVQAVEQAIRFAERSAFPDPSTLYDYVQSHPIHLPTCSGTQAQ